MQSVSSDTTIPDPATERTGYPSVSYVWRCIDITISDHDDPRSVCESVTESASLLISAIEIRIAIHPIVYSPEYDTIVSESEDANVSDTATDIRKSVIQTTTIRTQSVGDRHDPIHPSASPSVSDQSYPYQSIHTTESDTDPSRSV